MIIIGLGNKARQGKDTAGEAIVSYFNGKREHQRKLGLKVATPEARIFKFADALYKVCREEYGMKEKDAFLLQKVGEGRRNEFGLNYWIDQLAISMAEFNGIAVITDMRYTNEADWVKGRGGFTIQVTRLNEDGTQYIAADRDPNFISEIQLDSYNYDAYIRSKSSVLTAELAITHAEYFRALKGSNDR
jgi:hypothetical protein